MPPFDPLKTKIDPIFTGQKPSDPAKPASAYNVLTNQQYTPNSHTENNQTNAPKNITATGETPINPKSVIRTYKGDIQSAIEASHLSSINIALAENERLREQMKIGAVSENTPSPNTKNKLALIIGLILILAGGVSLGIFYYLFGSKNSTEEIAVQMPPALITTEYQDELNTSTLTSKNFNQTLVKKLLDIKLPVNNFYHPYLTIGTGTTRRLITTQEFTALAGFTIPNILQRTLLPDFMVGTYSFNDNLPFVILKTSYFENAYTGLLDWEINLKEDFQILFRLTNQINARPLDQLTFTPAKKFEDAVIVNKDVRVLRNDEGKIIFLYGLIDKETIIITVSDQAFKEILNRLNKEKGVKR